MFKYLFTLLLSITVSFSFAGTVVVTNTNDSGPGSLRASVASANTGDTIRFSTNLILGGSDTIILSSSIYSTKSLIYKGVYNSTDTLYISGDSLYRIFNLEGASIGINNVFDSVVLINGVISVPNQGGAIKSSSNFYSSEITILNSILRNNSSYQGGAIYIFSLYSYVNLTINNSKIDNNRSSNGAAGALVSASRKNSIVKVTNSVFSNNHNSGYNGGAIAASCGSSTDGDFAKVIATNSKFYNNTVNSSGGAINCYAGSNSDETSSYVTVNNCQFIGNKANNNGSGGAIYSYSSRNNSVVKVINSNFDNNTAGYYGGGIYSYCGKDSSKVNIKNTTFTNSTSRINGGAISNNGGLHNSTSVYQCSLNNNRSGDGGAIFSSAKSPFVTVLRTTMQNNYASSDGGAIDVYSNSYSTNIYVDSSDISYNSSAYTGGAIRAYSISSSSGKIAETTVKIKNSTLDSNSSNFGGFLYAASSLYSGDPTLNLTTDVEVINSTLTNNKTLFGNGGAIFANASTTYSIDSSISKVKIINSTLLGNSTANLGGTIYSKSSDLANSNYSNSSVQITSSILLSTDTNYIFNNDSIKISSGGNNLFSYNSIIGTNNSDSLNIIPSQVNLGQYSSLNGGVTRTRIPHPPSVAINKGNPTDNSHAQNRPVLGIRDIGAAEYNCQIDYKDTIISSASYLWKGKNYDTSGTFILTEINASGCDTIFTLILIIDTNTNFTTIVCGDSFSWYGTTYTNSGTYYQPLSTTPCCSGIDTLKLTLVSITSSIRYDTSCTNFISPSGKIFNTTGTYLDTIPNAKGCDSIITFHILIDTLSASSVASCKPFVWYGKTYATSGVYYQALSSLAGCGSFDTLTIAVTTLDTTITKIGNTLTSNDLNATYQWRNCDLAWPQFSGINRNYEVLYNGTYTVYVSENGCVSNPTCFGVYPTTLYVLNTQDNGYGSLRFAVDNAKKGDTIRFVDSLISNGSDTIFLGSTISIQKEIIIKGLYNLTDTLFISGSSLIPIFEVDLSAQSSKNFFLDSVSLINGNSAGNTNIYILGSGALYFEGDSLSISNSYFAENKSVYEGGAIYFKGGVIQIKNSIFDRNEAVNEGGAIKLESLNISVEVANSIFKNNVSKKGGAFSTESYSYTSVGVSGYSRFNFYKTDIINNSSSEDGGAIFSYSRHSVGGSYANTRNAYSNSNIVFDQCNIKNNHATTNGGAVYSFSYSLGKSTNTGNPNAISRIKAINCVIENNSSGQSGGAFYSLADAYNGNLNLSEVLLDSSIVMNNSAINDGGVIYSESDAGAAPGGSKVEINKSQVSNNTSNRYGGVVYNVTTRASLTTTNNATFHNNLAHNNGGVINSGSVDVNKTEFTSNESYANGGAIFVRYQVDLQNSQFNSNKADKGGAFYTSDYYDTNYIDSTQFFNNNATSNGGACFVSGLLRMKNSTVNNNVALKDGGGIYGYRMKSIELFSTTINNNKAKNGGGISIDSSGYIYSTDQQLIVHKSTITNNEASNHGGGIHMALKNGNGKLKIKNATISHNKALLKGAGVFCKVDSLDSYSSIIALNSINNNIENISSNTISRGYNLIGDSTFRNHLITDSLLADSALLLLGDLTNNGGFTKTRMPLVGSYALDNSSISDLTDGQNRPKKGVRDIGSAEGNCHLYKTDTVITCSNYTWKNNNYSTSGDYTSFSFKQFGCDSIYKLHLIIDTSGTSHVTACEEYTWYGTPYNQTGVYTQTLANNGLCNATDTLYLSILHGTTNSTAISVCNSYVNSNGKIYATNGVYRDTLVNSIGCDSILTFTLTINTPSSTVINRTACNQYYFSNNNVTYTASGVYRDTNMNSRGCDSIVILNLTIVPLANNFISKTNYKTLESLATGVGYQWLNCDNGFAAVPGETSKSFIATADGNYAVQLTKNGCTDTSTCYGLFFVGLNENSVKLNVKVFPNPSQGFFNVEFGKMKGTKKIRITDLSGKLVYKEEGIEESKRMISLPKELATGIYNVHIESSNESITIKLITQ